MTASSETLRRITLPTLPRPFPRPNKSWLDDLFLSFRGIRTAVVLPSSSFLGSLLGWFGSVGTGGLGRMATVAVLMWEAGAGPADAEVSVVLV